MAMAYGAILAVPAFGGPKGFAGPIANGLRMLAPSRAGTAARKAWLRPAPDQGRRPFLLWLPRTISMSQSVMPPSMVRLEPVI
jgi:hypothetical protein